MALIAIVSFAVVPANAQEKLTREICLAKSDKTAKIACLKALRKQRAVEQAQLDKKLERQKRELAEKQAATRGLEKVLEMQEEAKKKSD